MERPTFIAVHRAPYVLLFDESASSVEVRELSTGRLIELSVELLPVRTCRMERMDERAVVCVQRGAVRELVEVGTLQA
jgi:hypothetical protein